MTRMSVTLAVFALALASLACQQSPSHEGSTPPPAAAAGSDDSASTANESAVDYEPAYPADVSSEGLTEGDVAQQETADSHDDASHSHGEGETNDDHVH